MKKLITLAILLLSLSAFAENYECTAGKIELLKFKANISDAKIVLNYQGKDVTLKLDESATRSAQGWTIFSGKTLVNPAAREYLYMGINLSPDTRKNSDIINGSFYLSPPSLESGATRAYSYKLSCQII